MIPLSNGRSPRIDQFYATIRTFKSHRLQQDSQQPSEQDKSIQYIRSVGKQILQDASTHKKKSVKIDNVKAMMKSSESLLKPKNLYDKYKVQVDKKIVKEINNTKQNLIKQQIDKIPQKLKKDKKYQQIPSKIQQKNSLKGLNYVKRADIEAQKLKNNKIETVKIQKQIKQKQLFYERNMKIYKNSSKDLLTSGLLKRGEQTQARKMKCIQRIRQQQLEKQMKQAKFQPEMTSKRIETEHSFQKRTSIAKMRKLSNEKDIIKQVMQNYTFYPQTNRYKDSQSKIVGLWKQQKERSKSKLFNTLRIQDLDRESSYKQQQTTNSTTRINLKSLNQLSFIFQ